MLIKLNQLLGVIKRTTDNKNELSVNDIKEKLELLDVTFKANDTKPVLLEALTEELKGRLEEYEKDFDEDEAVDSLWTKVLDHEDQVKSGSND